MESKRFKPALLVPSTALLLLLLGTNTLAIAPGDESGECAVPDYPVNIKVLLDSWRYQTLLPQDGATNSAAVWTADESDSTWSSTGMCENSTVAVCAGGRVQKWLQTQYISKSVSAADTYPVRVFVNITYSCPEEIRRCDPELQLQIRPNRIDIAGDTTSSDTRHFYFDIIQKEEGFYLQLRSQAMSLCVTVSRVLVYRHECPGQPTGLTRRPATQAPVSGTVLVTPYCAENSHLATSVSQRLLCTAEGEWINSQNLMHCQCDQGYYKDGGICKGSIPPADLATDRLTSVTQTPIVSGSIAPTDLATDKLTSVTQTPVIKTSNIPAPTDMRDTESFSEDSDPVAVFAGVSVMMVVIIALVILLIVVLVWKKRKMHAVANRKDDNSPHRFPPANPLYDAVERETNGTTANGTVDTHTPKENGNHKESLYRGTREGNVSADTDTQEEEKGMDGDMAECPTLPQLLCFPVGNRTVDIVEQIGFKYGKLGPILLQDTTGAKVEAIIQQYRDRANSINQDVLSKWLRGEGKQPVSWTILAAALDQCGLTELARDIRSVKSSGKKKREAVIGTSSATEATNILTDDGRSVQETS